MARPCLVAVIATALRAAMPAAAPAAYRDFRSPLGKPGFTECNFGRLRCTSRKRGITCRSARSDHGFTISVEKQRVF